MTILNIAYYTFIRNLRDIKAMTNMILFPIVLILILGTALSSLYEPQIIGKTEVAYLNQDEGQISEIVDAKLQGNGIKDYLELKKVSTYEEGLKLVEDKKVSALIKIEKGFSEKIKNGTKADVEILTDNVNELRPTIVKSIAGGITDGINVNVAIMKLGGQGGDPSGLKSLEESPITAEGKMPRAMDYYAVTMLVLIALYGANYGTHGLAEDFFGAMGGRLKGTPVRMYKHLIGKTLGMVLTIFCQMVVLVLFTKYVYQANWGSNIPMVLAIALTLSILSVALGIMLCAITKNGMTATGILNVIIPISTLLSGGYAKFSTDNEVFNTIRYIFPNHLAQTSMFNTIYEGSMSQVYLCLAIMWVMIAVMFIAASSAGRRRLI
ncbi:MAG: ABC transporter permease [Clostridia bacterium]|nr:ABC transporter permease [Clostridia bacterium]